MMNVNQNTDRSEASPSVVLLEVNTIYFNGVDIRVAIMHSALM